MIMSLAAVGLSGPEGMVEGVADVVAGLGWNSAPP
jgi:hypothetical protein